VGRFMSSFGFTSSFAIAVSLIVSFTLTPMLAARMIKRKKSGPTKPVVKKEHEEGRSSLAEFKDKYEQASSKSSRFYGPIDRTYTWMLKWAMAHRWAIVGLSLLVIISIVPLFMLVGKNFL